MRMVSASAFCSGFVFRNPALHPCHRHRGEESRIRGRRRDLPLNLHRYVSELCLPGQQLTFDTCCVTNAV